MPNNSPWLKQLKNRRQVKILDKNHDSEIAVIGGGIAGVSTAYYLLRDTAHKVTLVEATNIAHGATGHNAGQIVAIFEKPFEELVADFGLEMAAAGQKALDDTWIMLEEIFRDTGINVPFYRFNGYEGFDSLELILQQLAKNHYLHQSGLTVETILVVDDFAGLKDIPTKFDHLYKKASAIEVLSLLETANKSLIACLPMVKGVMNSALFCEELVEYLETTYPDRLMVLEHSPVKKVILNQDSVLLEADDRPHKIKATRVILCTNGFENIEIVNDGLVDIDTKFHHEVYGRVGYMAGYLADQKEAPTAMGYYLSEEIKKGIPYFYLTRRPYEHEKITKNLIALGGPELILPDRSVYHPRQEYLPEAPAMIDNFIHQTYKLGPKGKIDYAFEWHGLMGYTKSGIRLVGVEPCNERLLYNLGCNGVGIIPSIYGGWRIGQIIAGKKLAPSIFDPKDLRCAVPK